MLSELLQADPEPPQRLERAAPLLVPLARSGTGVSVREPVQLLRQRGALEARPRPKARLRHGSGASRPKPTPPQASITAGPSPGGFTNNPTPGFSFASNEPGSTFECRIDASPFKPCSSPHTPPPLSDGAHAFYVRAIDAPGNESQIRSRSFTVDTAAPAVTISSGPAEGTISSDPSPSFGFASNESGASLSCQLDGGGFQRCSSPFTASGLADGSHTFRVRATDRAQNTGAASRTWIVDTTDPTVTITSGPADGSTSSERSHLVQLRLGRARRQLRVPARRRRASRTAARRSPPPASRTAHTRSR